MDIHRLEYFIAVAEEQHFGHAAERLHVAQSGLSQQIKRLEASLGARLFDRTTRRVELTDAGRALLPEAHQVLNAAASARAAVTSTIHGETGIIRIGFVASAALSIVPRVVQALRDRWAGLSLELIELTTDPQLQQLHDGALELGIVREVGPSSELTVTTLVVERLYVALPHSHILAGRRSVPLSSLADEPFIVFPRRSVPRLYDHLAGLCDRAGFRFKPIQEALQFSTIVGLVASGVGVAIVPEPLRALQLPGLEYVGIEDEGAKSTISLVCRSDRLDSNLVSNAYAAAQAAAHPGSTAGSAPGDELSLSTSAGLA